MVSLIASTTVQGTQSSTTSTFVLQARSLITSAALDRRGPQSVRHRQHLRESELSGRSSG